MLLAGSMAGAVWGVADAASSAGPSRTPGATQASSEVSTPPVTSGAAGTRPPGPQGGAWHGRRPFGGAGMIGGIGAVTAITESSITVKSPNAGTRTILTTAKTAYVEAMAVVPRADLRIGQNVGVLVKPVVPPAGSEPGWARPGAPRANGAAGSPSSTGSASGTSPDSASGTSRTPTALAIEILVPQLAGRVVSVSTAKIVVEGPGGLRQSLVTSSSTTYRELDTPVALSTVVAGEDVVGFGSVAADHSELNATTVAIVGPVAGGKVTAVAGSTITVESPRGTIKISTTSSTIFRASSGSSSLASVKTGDLVLAVGLQAGKGGFTASGVWSRTAAGSAGSLGAVFGPGGWPALGLGGPAPGFGGWPSHGTSVGGGGGDKPVAGAGTPGEAGGGFGGFSGTPGGFAPGGRASPGAPAASGATTT